MAFHFKKLKIPGLIYIETDVFGDDRGFFVELFKTSVFKTNGIVKPIVQVNHSKSFKGVLRGLHYQKPPRAQGKLISVVCGEIFDVTVDIRKGSPTYAHWFGINLEAKTKNMLYVPEGLAHGFYTMSKVAEVIYHCTDEYSKDHERGIIWNDPAVAIAWPVNNPLVSEKDKKFPLLKDADNNFRYLRN